nr:hypothetical protein [Mycoplasmopsis bovis]
MMTLEYLLNTNLKKFEEDIWRKDKRKNEKLIKNSNYSRRL